MTQIRSFGRTPHAAAFLSNRGNCALCPLSVPDAKNITAISQSSHCESTTRNILPAANILLGTALLSRLLERFDHEPILALAAYNTGEERVRGWLARCPELPAGEVIERMGSRQTRLYVRRVLRYRALEAR